MCSSDLESVGSNSSNVTYEHGIYREEYGVPGNMFGPYYVIGYCSPCGFDTNLPSTDKLNVKASLGDVIVFSYDIKENASTTNSDNHSSFVDSTYGHSIKLNHKISVIPIKTDDNNLGPPSDSNASEAEPVNIINGNMYIIKTDLSSPAPGIPFEFTRTYNSLDGLWRHNFDIKLTPIASAGVLKQKEVESKPFSLRTVLVSSNPWQVNIPH